MVSAVMALLFNLGTTIGTKVRYTVVNFSSVSCIGKDLCMLHGNEGHECLPASQSVSQMFILDISVSLELRLLLFVCFVLFFSPEGWGGGGFEQEKE